MVMHCKYIVTHFGPDLGKAVLFTYKKLCQCDCRLACTKGTKSHLNLALCQGLRTTGATVKGDQARELNGECIVSRYRCLRPQLSKPHRPWQKSNLNPTWFTRSLPTTQIQSQFSRFTDSVHHPKDKTTGWTYCGQFLSHFGDCFTPFKKMLMLKGDFEKNLKSGIILRNHAKKYISLPPININ